MALCCLLGREGGKVEDQVGNDKDMSRAQGRAQDFSSSTRQAQGSEFMLLSLVLGLIVMSLKHCLKTFLFQM